MRENTEDRTEAEEEAKCTKKRKRDDLYSRKRCNNEKREDHKERHVHFTHNKRGNSFGPVTHIEIKDELIARKAKVNNPSIITHKTRPQNGADRDDRERDI